MCKPVWLTWSGCTDHPALQTSADAENEDIPVAWLKQLTRVAGLIVKLL